jgi:type III pantothenate kinase
MPDAVVDIGNSRIKFCRCDCNDLHLPVRGMGAEDHAGWNRLIHEWEITKPYTWAVAASDPGRREEFITWAKERGDAVISLDSHKKIPTVAKVDFPERVGIDRLLNAYAARIHVRGPQSAIIVSAGSAVTVDLLDVEGAFAGGTIFPGLRLMALSMNEHTAKLPLIDTTGYIPDGPPGKNTEAAMRLGIMYAVTGGIDSIIREMASGCKTAPQIFLTGGDMTPQLAGLLQTRHQFRSVLMPTLTLEGIHRAAELLE